MQIRTNTRGSYGIKSHLGHYIPRILCTSRGKKKTNTSKTASRHPWPFPFPLRHSSGRSLRSHLRSRNRIWMLRNNAKNNTGITLYFLFSYREHGQVNKLTNNVTNPHSNTKIQRRRRKRRNIFTIFFKIWEFYSCKGRGLDKFSKRRRGWK